MLVLTFPVAQDSNVTPDLCPVAQDVSDSPDLCPVAQDSNVRPDTNTGDFLFCWIVVKTNSSARVRLPLC